MRFYPEPGILHCIYPSCPCWHCVGLKAVPQKGAVPQELSWAQGGEDGILEAGLKTAGS